MRLSMCQKTTLKLEGRSSQHQTRTQQNPIGIDWKRLKVCCHFECNRRSSRFDQIIASIHQRIRIIIRWQQFFSHLQAELCINEPVASKRSKRSKRSNCICWIADIQIYPTSPLKGGVNHTNRSHWVSFRELPPCKCTVVAALARWWSIKCDIVSLLSLCACRKAEHLRSSSLTVSAIYWQCQSNQTLAFQCAFKQLVRWPWIQSKEVEGYKTSFHILSILMSHICLIYGICCLISLPNRALKVQNRLVIATFEDGDVLESWCE